MDRERCKELLPVLQAFAEGKTIQCRGMGLDWAAVSTNPTWEADEYRIKPEPREFWLFEPWKNSNPCCHQGELQPRNQDNKKINGWIKVREVLE